jgi:thiol-disulfide isomerase/thioredoxin
MITRLKLVLTIFLVLLTTNLLLSMGTKAAKYEKAKASSIELFKQLPAEDIYGKKITYDKKLYLLDIWATWCPPCQMTIPELIELQELNFANSFAVIGLSADENIETVLDFFANKHLNYSVAMLNKDILNLFPPVRGIPTMFLVNNQGRIINTYIGYTKKDIMQADIDKYLAK